MQERLINFMYLKNDNQSFVKFYLLQDQAVIEIEKLK